ncbi:MAG TPA: extradiol dioxygenase [Candidatus Dormibacteraeota bacterium]|jgi:catechol 2,3-dioxygenase-like lactoylglutathione lyase family enzyme|nr:extradiol dioxygenase [Candidatus Dormibacteraeota bacterium]
MISGSHVIVYSEDAEADRAFIRDVLGYRNVDAGGGWLIFKLPPAEVAVHPSDGPGRTELYLMCDDINATMTDLAAKGVEFATPVNEERWGILTAIKLPGGGELGLYQPKHPTAYNL